MSPFLAALLAAILPLLLDWAFKWIEDRFKKAEQAVGPVTNFASNEAYVAAVFDHAISSCPRWARGRRSFLRRLKAQAIRQADTLMKNGKFSLSADEVEELAELGASASEE